MPSWLIKGRGSRWFTDPIQNVTKPGRYPQVAPAQTLFSPGPTYTLASKSKRRLGDEVEEGGWDWARTSACHSAVWVWHISPAFKTGKREVLGCYGVRRFVRQEEKRTLILSTRGPPQSRPKSSSCRDAPRSTHCHPTGAMAQPWALTRGRRRESLRHAVSDWRSECYLHLFTAVRSKSYTQEVTSRTMLVTAGASRQGFLRKLVLHKPLLRQPAYLETKWPTQNLFREFSRLDVRTLSFFPSHLVHMNAIFW